ncbi:MAG: MAPEG family protein [Rhodospirillaceae bacterium]|nr:MAPEG family protein [Rhodospirillaceae bacterium]
MPQSSIYAPFFAMMALTFAVWVYMYVRRIRFITGNNISPRELEKPGELARLSPPAISNPSDNLKNLFELPVLFYAVVLYLGATGQADDTYTAAAWVFVSFRTLHSIVHCTVNIVIVRFYIYIASSLALWFIIGRAALGAFG